MDPATNATARRWRRPSVAVLLVALCSLMALCSMMASCSSTPSATRDDTAGAYAVIVRWFVDHSAVDTERRLVFVQPLGDGATIGLETQAALIAGTTDFADVRFIDDRSEALGDDGVRDGGILLALGPADPDGNRVTIATEEITSVAIVTSETSETVTQAWTFELVVRSDVWTLSEEPTPSS